MGRPSKFVVAKETLWDLYVTQGLSHRNIATRCGCCMETVRYWLLKYAIPMRGRGAETEFRVDEQYLRKRYHEDKWTAKEIAKELGCGPTVVWRAILQYGLQIDDDEQLKRRLERNKIRFADFAHNRSSSGYQYVMRHDHPLANSNGYVSEHRVNAEAAMGRGIKPGERVHHINLNKRDNAPTNLAVLPSQAVHRMVHEYMDRCGAFLCGLTTARPEPLKFGVPVFWAGHWVTQIDLIPAEPQVSFLEYDNMFAESARAPAVN